MLSTECPMPITFESDVVVTSLAKKWQTSNVSERVERV